MRRRSESAYQDAEFPSRYVLDEARFTGGRERICSKEDDRNEPTAHLPQ